MPEEELKNDFTDLPNAPTEASPPAAPVEGKEEKPSSNDDMAKLLVEKERMAQEEREKRKAEVKKRKELEAEIERLKQKPPEEEEDEEEKPSIDARSIQETVKQTIHEESYNKDINTHIRAIPGITRPLAEELDKTVRLLPKSNDPEADVRAAMAYLNARNSSTFSAPVVNAGFGGFNTTKAPISQSAVKLGEAYGLKAEDFNKYSGEVKL